MYYPPSLRTCRAPFWLLSLQAFSVGYTTDNPPKINNITELRAGFTVSWSPTAVGTLTFTAAPVTPPTTPGAAPTVVLSPVPPAGAPLQVFGSPYLVDASK